MYNFSGIIYRIWAVCGILFALGIVCLLFERPWKKGFKIRNIRYSIVAISVAVCLGLIYLSRVISPGVSSYTGEFVISRRNSSEAPPLPFTNEFVFWNGEGKKQKFYLDTFSKKEIITNEFQKGQQYTIYYDKFTQVIVKVEIVEER